MANPQKGSNMPQPGTTPDCVHCRFMVRQQNGEYRCRQHNMTLHSPVRIFCKQITPPTTDRDDYELWFESTINVDQLAPNTLYTWVEITTRDKRGRVETHIDNEVVAPLTSYITWSAGTFWQVLRGIRDGRRDYYRRHGYEIED